MDKPLVFFQDGVEREVADLAGVMILLGRVSEGVDRLRQDFSEEKASAAESRKAIHDRHDEMRGDITSIKSDIDMSAVITSQKITELSKKFEAHKDAVQPSIEDWQRIKSLGLGISGVLAIGGLSVGAMLAAGIDTLRAALRHWLGG